jgi:hypothetical protein
MFYGGDRRPLGNPEKFGTSLRPAIREYVRTSARREGKKMWRVVEDLVLAGIGTTFDGDGATDSSDAMAELGVAMILDVTPLDSDDEDSQDS